MSELPKNLVFKYENSAINDIKNIFSTSSKAVKSIPINLNICIDTGLVQLKLKYVTAISVSFFIGMLILSAIICLMRCKLRAYRRGTGQERRPIYNGEGHNGLIDDNAENNLTSFSNPYANLTTIAPSTSGNANFSENSSVFASANLNNMDLLKCIAEMWPYSNKPVTTETKLKEKHAYRIKRLKQYQAFELSLFHRENLNKKKDLV